MSERTDYENSKALRARAQELSVPGRIETIDTRKDREALAASYTRQARKIENRPPREGE